MIELGAGLGYDLYPRTRTPLRLFLRYQLFPELPAGGEGALPLIPHAAFVLGGSFSFGRLRPAEGRP